MLARQSGQLEHGDFVFAEHGLQLGVTQDIALVGRVLKIVGFDIHPHLFDHLGARQKGGPHDRGQRRAGLQRFGKRRFFLGAGVMELQEK